MQPGVGGSQVGGQRRRQGAPEVAQDVGGQVLGTGHQRRGEHQEAEFGLVGWPHVGQRGAILGAGGLDAERRDVTSGEVAPPDEDRGQDLADLTGAKAQQALAAALGEGLLETVGDRLVHARGVGDWLADQVALGREAEAERHHGGGTVSRKAASAQGAGLRDWPFAKIRCAFQPSEVELVGRSGSATSAALW